MATQTKKTAPTMEHWALLWYQCLSENYDYSIYAIAREKDDAKECKRLEQKFKLIEDIYGDFGKLESWRDGGLDSYWWQEWFKEKKYLFMPDVKAVESDAVQEVENNLLLSVPIQGSLEETVREAQRQIELVYKARTVKEPKPPKYQLRMINGRVAHGYEEVRQAVITSVGKYVYPPNSQDQKSIRTSMLEFLDKHIYELGWTIDAKARQDLSDGEMDNLRYDSFRARINTSRKKFRAFSRNTLRASFPDDRPFDSYVWDRFTNKETLT
ncbi:hypothetical protein [Hydrogenophaga defluvii]|uniref:Uncharacterized protein n=1 Tax=Hydrogenophaga defluvii TaxID=249410 RepID=A0ABW2SE95_9BURK